MDSIIGLRWWSWMNPEMDLVVLVKEKDRSVAEKAISKGVADFWEDDDLAYGDCIELALKRENIPFVIEYEEDHGNDEAWERHLNAYWSIGIAIFEVAQ